MQAGKKKRGKKDKYKSSNKQIVRGVKLTLAEHCISLRVVPLHRVRGAIFKVMSTFSGRVVSRKKKDTQ